MENKTVAPTTVQDPVCGMQVVPGIARSWDYLYEAAVYHFCGPDCRSRFAADAKGILKGGPGQLRIETAAPENVQEAESWWSMLQERIQRWLS